MSMCAKKAEDRLKAILRPGFPSGFGIGARLGSPSLVDFLLFVDADLFSDRIELRGHTVKDGLGIFAGPQAADRLAHCLVIFVLLQQREVKQARFTCLLDRVEIGRRIWPQLAI